MRRRSAADEDAVHGRELQQCQPDLPADVGVAGRASAEQSHPGHAVTDRQVGESGDPSGEQLSLTESLLVATTLSESICGPRWLGGAIPVTRSSAGLTSQLAGMVAESRTAVAAVRITSATASGRETMMTFEPSVSMVVAPACSAVERITSVPAALSRDATTAQDGEDFHAGGPDDSVNADSAIGRWVAAMIAVCSGGRSAATASWNFAGSIANSTAVSAPSLVGYRSGTSDAVRTLSRVEGREDQRSDPAVVPGVPIRLGSRPCLQLVGDRREVVADRAR